MTEDPWSMYEQKLLSGKHSLNMVHRVLDIVFTLQFTINNRKDLLPIMIFKQISHMNFPMFSDISKLYGVTFSVS